MNKPTSNAPRARLRTTKILSAHDLAAVSGGRGNNNPNNQAKGFDEMARGNNNPNDQAMG
jgi:hypothetical protein